jgi:hypothetical protein
MFKITNKKLLELDKEVALFYKTIDSLSSFLVNVYAKKKYESALIEIRKKLQKIKPESEFDELIINNIESNLRLNDLMIDYFTNPNCALGTIEMIDKLVGKDTYRKLEENAKSIPWEKEWINANRKQEREYSRISPFAEEAQSAVKKWIPKIKKNLIKYGREVGFLSSDFDFTIILLPPKEGSEWSNWNSKTKIFSLASYGFKIFMRNGKVIANPAGAYSIAFHEIFGHAAHQYESDKLPESVWFTEEIAGVVSTKSVTEGVALSTDNHCIDFLRENLKKFGLNEEDAILLEEDQFLTKNSKLYSMFAALVKDRELREKDFDGYKYILEVTKNPVLAHHFKHDYDNFFMDIWERVGHAFGPWHYSLMVNKVVSEFGDDFIKKNAVVFNRASLMGVWSWEVYPQAVVYFLKNIENV